MLSAILWLIGGEVSSLVREGNALIPHWVADGRNARSFLSTLFALRAELEMLWSVLFWPLPLGTDLYPYISRKVGYNAVLGFTL